MQPDGTVGNTTERLITAIRVELARRNLSQAAAARLIGKTPPAFSQRMTGQVAFTVEEIVQLASACKIPISDLISDDLAAESVSAA